MVAVVLLAQLILGAGCRSLPRDFYPLGLWGVRDTNDLELVRGVGFNVVHGPATPAWLAAADAADLRVLAAAGVGAGRGREAAAARKAIAAGDKHRRLWAWYLYDEPDLHLTDPELVTGGCRQWKRCGATKPVGLSLLHGASAGRYGAGADVVLLNRYPVPWLPLASFAQHLQLARLGLGPEKALVPVLQAFDWSYHTDLIGAPPPFRAPTYAELRCMAYSALVEGAQGLFFYTFDDGRWKMSEHLEVWFEVHAVVSEVNARRPLFLGKPVWWARAEAYTNIATAYNAALRGAIISVRLRVGRGNVTCPPGEYLVAVNTTDRVIDYRCTVPWPRVTAVAVLGERREVAVRRAWLEDRFEAFGVHVYGPVASRETGTGRRVR
jgi:hypothetical protein